MKLCMILFALGLVNGTRLGSSMELGASVDGERVRIEFLTEAERERTLAERDPRTLAERDPRTLVEVDRRRNREECSGCERDERN